MLIIVYLFKHLYGIMHRCLHSRAAHNPLITWVFRGAYFVPVGILFPPINFLVIPFPPFLSLDFGSCRVRFLVLKRQSSSLGSEGAPSPAQHRVAASPQVANPPSTTLHTIPSAALIGTAALPCSPPAKPLLAFPCPAVSWLQEQIWKRQKKSSRHYFISVVSLLWCGIFLATLGFFTP